MHKMAYRVETVVCVWGLLLASHSLYTALNLKRHTSNSRAAVSYTEHMYINLIVSSYSCKRKRRRTKSKLSCLVSSTSRKVRKTLGAVLTINSKGYFQSLCCGYHGAACTPCVLHAIIHKQHYHTS